MTNPTASSLAVAREFLGQIFWGDGIENVRRLALLIEAAAKKKGQLAVPSILRDWIKAQVTAIEIGVMPFDHAFMPHMLAYDGRRVVEHMEGVLQISGPSQRTEME